MAAPFDGMPSSTELTVYDTSTGGKVAEAAYGNLTVGFLGRVTDDGTKLALHAGQHVAVLDMTTGKVLKTGTRLDVTDHTKFTPRAPEWLAENRVLLLDWNLMVDVESGIALGGFRLPDSKSSEPLALADWIGGEYVRYSQNYGYWRFPVEQLTAAGVAMTDPNQNLLAQRQVSLQLNGCEKLSPLEQDMVRECLKVIIDTRCNLKVVDEAKADLPVVEVAYSESRKEGPFSRERWHQDATRQAVNTDRNTWVKDQYVLNVSLSFRCVTADGRVLAEDKGEGLGLPGGMNFDVPGSVQFRNAAIMKAAENLTLNVPALVPHSADGSTIPRSWPIELVKADPPDYAAMTIEKIDINNSWLGEEHGLPVRLAAMSISEDQRKEISPRGFSQFHFVKQTDDSPAMLMHAADAEWFLLPVTRKAAVSKPQLPSARRFALHPNGEDFAAFDDKRLSLGSVNQLSRIHEEEIDPGVVIDMSFSGDGSLLAIGLGQKVGIHVYAVDDLKKVSQLDNATPAATFNEPNVQSSLSFSRNSNRFVTASRDTIIVWDVDSKRGIFEHQVQSTRLKPVTVRAVAMGADGKRLFASLGNDVVEFSLETLMEVRRLPEPDATALAISPVGDRLAIARQTDTIAVMNVDGEPSLQIYNMGNSVNGRPKVGWSYDGSMMYGFGSGGLSVWNMGGK